MLQLNLLYYCKFIKYIIYQVNYMELELGKILILVVSLNFLLWRFIKGQLGKLVFNNWGRQLVQGTWNESPEENTNPVTLPCFHWCNLATDTKLKAGTWLSGLLNFPSNSACKKALDIMSTGTVNWVQFLFGQCSIASGDKWSS